MLNAFHSCAYLLLGRSLWHQHKVGFSLIERALCIRFAFRLYVCADITETAAFNTTLAFRYDVFLSLS